MSKTIDPSTNVSQRAEHASRVPRGTTWGGPLTGFGFIGLLVVSFSFAPQPPALDAAVEDIRAHFVEHGAGIRTYGLFQSLAAMAFLLFACWLASIVWDEARTRILPLAIVAAAAVGMALSLVGAAITTTLAFGVATTAEPAVVQALFHLADLVLDVGDPTLTLVIGAFTAAAGRRSWMPRWFVVAGAAVAAAWFVGTVAVVSTTGFFAGVNGPWGMTIVALLTLWIGGVAIVGRRASVHPDGSPRTAVG